MNKTNRYIALTLTLILALGCFNMSPQNRAEATGEIGIMATGIEDGIITLYAQPSSYDLAAKDAFTVDIKTRDEIKGLYSFKIELFYDGNYFNGAKNTQTLTTRLAANSLSTSMGGAGGSGSEQCNLYMNYTAKSPINISANETLFTVNMSVLSNVTANHAVKLWINTGSEVTRKETIEGEEVLKYPLIVNEETSVNVIGSLVPNIELNTSAGGVTVGATWTANVLDPVSGVTYNYQWYRRSGSSYTPLGGLSPTNKSYTLTANEVGYYVGVQVTASGSGYTGSARREHDVLIEKKPGGAPPGVTSIYVDAANIGDTWVVLLANSNYEYAITPYKEGETNMAPANDNAWKSGNVFDKLTPNTTYCLWARYPATADTKASEAYPAPSSNPDTLCLVTTLRTSHQISITSVGDNVNDPCTVYYTVPSGEAITAGTILHLFALPTDDYYFDHWECTYPGGVIPIQNETSATDATVTMPSNLTDKTFVNIVGYFHPKADTSILVIDNSKITYGKVKSITNPYEYFNIRLFGGVGEASDKLPGYSQYVKDKVKIYYRPVGSQSAGEEFPLYTNSPDETDLDAGKYQLIVYYEGDDKNRPARNEQAIFEVLQAPGVKPEDPEVGDIGDDYIVIKDTEPTQMYLVYPNNTYLPETSYSNWTRGTGGDMKWSGLYPASEYQVCTYVPGSANYTESPIAYVVKSTKHTWKVSVHDDGPNGKISTSEHFFQQNEGGVQGNPAPVKKEIHIKNEGNGTVGNVVIDINNDSTTSTGNVPADWFTVSGMSVSTLAPGASGYFTITPSAGLPEGDYIATITINASQNEPDSNETASTSEKTPGSVIEGLTKTIKLYYSVSEHPPIEIFGLDDLTVTYDGKPHAIGTTGLTFSQPGFTTGDLEFSYEGTAFDNTHYNDTEPPVKAGTYIVTAKPRALDPDDVNDAGKTQYVGYASATVTIEKRELNIVDLVAVPKLYDGTPNAKITGGSFKEFDIVSYTGGIKDEVWLAADESAGVMEGGMPTIGYFNDKHHGTDKDVRMGTDSDFKLTLAGADASNYELVQPVLQASIQAKPVMPILDPIFKTYDGTVNIPTVKANFVDGDVYPEDALTVEFHGCKTATRNVGKDIDIVMGTMVVTGNSYSDYIVDTPALPKAQIIPKKVYVTVSGQPEFNYDGTPKSLTASYETCVDDTPAIDIIYTGMDGESSTSAPWLSGRYLIDAVIRDPNYEKDGDIRGIREMTIVAGKLYHTDVTRSVIPGDVSIKMIPLTTFNLTTSVGYSGVAGTYSIGSVIDDSGIMDAGYPKIESNVVSFRVKNSARLDQFAQIQILFTPDSGTYEPVEMYLKVIMAPEGYTNSIINAPSSVNIGDAINLSNIRLRTVFDSDGHVEDALVTESMLASGYDRTDLRPSNLGLKNVVVSYPGNPLRTASFNINVVDVIETFSIMIPDKLTYYWLIDQKLDLTGGLIMPTMRTNSAADAIPMQAGMLSVSNSTLLNIGEYKVNVTYQKILKQNAFTIKVVEPPAIGIEDPPSGSDPGVLQFDDEATFKDSAGKNVEVSNIQLVIAPLASMDQNKLWDAIAEDAFFKKLPSDSLQVLDISLKDKTTGLDVQPSSNVTFRLNYPTGTDRSTTIRVLHVHRDNKWEVYPPTRREEGLELTVSSFSPFAIGWIAQPFTDPEDPADPSPSVSPSASPGTSPSPSASPGQNSPQPSASATSSPTPTPSPTPGIFKDTSLTESEVAFWEAVLDMVQSAEKGAVIRVNARSYDKMPVEVMEAMDKSTDLTLVISWNGGDDITITSKTAFKPESTRVYFPLSLLADLFSTDPPKTDDPDEGEEWLNSQRSEASSSTRTGSTDALPDVVDESRFREAMSDYLANAIANSNGNVYDITAPVDAERDSQAITSKTEGWLSSEGDDVGGASSNRPSIGSPIVNGPGLGALLIIMGVMLALAGAATGLYILKSRRLREEDDE